ncbi:MAG: hypothetical protein ACE5IO_03855 [Thermoplasmata archaeon]
MKAPATASTNSFAWVQGVAVVIAILSVAWSSLYLLLRTFGTHVTPPEPLYTLVLLMFLAVFIGASKNHSLASDDGL